MRKEVWFGLSIMAFVVILVFALMPAPSQMTNGHLGLLMLAMIVVGIMLGFPTAFTLMGMGVIFGWLAYRSVDPATAVPRVLDLFVQRTYGVMSNDVLIAIPLFLFMGYLVERAQLIDRLFRSLHLATARIPGALAVATIVTCAIFATATGIVGAVVTLMGLLAFPAMLKAGYNTKVAAGAITAGGCLGILIPPSVMLIVYGAVAGVSVVQLYAGAFLPGIMLATLYIGYIILLAMWKPHLMPPLPEAERHVDLPAWMREQQRRGANALTGLFRIAAGSAVDGVSKGTAWGQVIVTLVPAAFVLLLLGFTYRVATAPAVEVNTAGLIQAGGLVAAPEQEREGSTGLVGGVAEPDEKDSEAAEAPAAAASEAASAAAPAKGKQDVTSPQSADKKSGRARRRCAATAGTPVAVDHLRHRRRAHRNHLRTLELGTAPGVQDVAELVLSACLADPGGARLDRVRIVYALRSGGGRRLRRSRSGGDLPFHRQHARIAQWTRERRRRLEDGETDGQHRQGIVLPDRQDQCDGVLALRRFRHLLGVLRAAGRAGGHREVGAVARHDAPAVHDPGAVHHLPAGVAARVDGDHHHLHADLHPAAPALQHRSAVLRVAGRAQPADGVPLAAGGNGGVLPQGRVAPARDAQRDLRGHDAVHGDPGRSPSSCCTHSRRSGSGCRRLFTNSEKSLRRPPAAIATRAGGEYADRTAAMLRPRGGAMLVSEILRIKGNALYTTTPDAPVLGAVKVMAQHDIGSLVVMDHGRMAGLVTFAEVLRALADREGTIGSLTISEITDRNPLTAAPSIDVNELRRIMLERHARYVPVLDGTTLQGVVSFHDVAKAVLEEQGIENRMLKSYISDSLA